MALWGNKDSVYSAGTISVNLATGIATGGVGVVTWTTSNGISTGQVLTVGAGATYGYAIITGFTSTSLSLASTSFFVSGLTTVSAGAAYNISQEPVYTLGDSKYRAPEMKTTGFSTSNFFTGVFGVDTTEAGVARTTTVGGKAGAFGVAHAGWVGVTTYVDCHGNFRVKSETLVAGSTITTDASDDTQFPDS
jgi:hypothetical protein